MKKVLICTLNCFLFVNFYAQQGEIVTVYAGKQISINTSSPTKQKEVGKAVMEFVYEYSYLTDTTDITSEIKDMMILQVGYGISKFTSYRVMQIDSLINVSTADQIKANPGKYIGGETFSIYKNYPVGKFTTTDKISTDWFMYEEDIPIQDWRIDVDGTKEILGYKCKRAECDFRGRKYIAWYCEDIAVADGPWKFGGLMGFIMEINDIEEHYKFTLVGINSNAVRDITIPDVQYNKTTRGKFYNTKHKYDINPVGYMSSVSGVNVIITSPDGTHNNAVDQPRELQYDYIERDYRR